MENEPTSAKPSQWLFVFRWVTAAIPLANVGVYAAMMVVLVHHNRRLPGFEDPLPPWGVPLFFSSVYGAIATAICALAWPFVGPSTAEVRGDPRAAKIDRLFWIGFSMFVFVLAADPGGGIEWSRG